MKERLEFYLSLGLFSSFDIDAGTRLLLKTIAQQNLVAGNEMILDAGCGTGVIAVSLKKKYPDSEVTAVDRSALALYFTEKNAKLNKLPEAGFSVKSGFLPGSLHNPFSEKTGPFDLIVSNIPAKAGNPVIEDFLTNCGMHLKPGGRAAVVIVEPLAGFAEETLINSGAEITYTESNSRYSVFHFIPAEKDEQTSLPDIYRRNKNIIAGFYGLPEFDSISYSTKLTIDVLRNTGCSGSALFWNPGIGHAACKCSATDEIILAGTDLLQLKASAYNLSGAENILHLPKFSSLTDCAIKPLNRIIASPDFINGAGVAEEVILTSKRILAPRGKLLITGKSSDIAGLEKKKNGFIIKKSMKYRGFRTLLLEKP